MYKAIDLKDEEFDVQMIGPFPAGLAILAGDPKAGKSWFALQLCVEVAQNLGTVLCMALEDTPGRIASRVRQLGRSLPENLWVTHDMEISPDKFVEEHPDTKLIVIDTLEQYQPGGFTSYVASVENLNSLHRLTQNNPGLLIMLLHHKKKNKSGGDVFNGILGTSGIGGSVDTLIVLERDRDSKMATLHMTGRDVEVDRIEMEFTQSAWVMRQGEDKVPEGDLQLPPSMVGLAALLFIFIMLIMIIGNVHQAVNGP